MEDIVLKNCRLLEREGLNDIGIKLGRISKVGRELKGEEEYDVSGKIVLPGMGDMHIHLDSAMTLGKPRYNRSGTLLEGIEIWGEYKKSLSKDEVKERAKKAIEWMVVQGITMIRTHADVTESKLEGLKALLELREEMRELVDIQVTAFPQDGILTDNWEGSERYFLEIQEQR